MNTTPAIHLRDLRKTFRIGFRRRRTEAVCGLDLDVAPGEVFGFFGPNGAGKTTTIKILVGLLRPDSGEARLFDREAADPRARSRTAYLPELPDFYDYLTPFEFLLHCGRVSALPGREARRRVPALLEKVGLDPGERRQLRKFSKGMLQRIGLAQAMLADPDLYILDEPMSGLDPVGRRWAKDLLLELSRAGKTIFFSSHVLAEAETICNRVAFLQRGRLVGEGNLSDLLRSAAGTYEILVSGHPPLKDAGLDGAVTEMLPNGPDTLLVLKRGQAPETVLQNLLARGCAIRSCGQRSASLEDIFLETMAAASKREG